MKAFFIILEKTKSTIFVMNSLRSVRLFTKSPIFSRNFGSSAPPTKGKVFQPKTFEQAWLQDAGAYPVMSVIVFAVLFCSSYGFYVMGTHPDARISKGNRKTFFRGEFKRESEGYDGSSLASNDEHAH